MCSSDLTIFLIFDFLTYRINKIVKDILINKGKEFLCQQVIIGDIDTTILGSSVKINNVEIRNLEGFKDKNIIQIKNIKNNYLKLLLNHTKEVKLRVMKRS